MYSLMKSPLHICYNFHVLVLLSCCLVILQLQFASALSFTTCTVFVPSSLSTTACKQLYWSYNINSGVKIFTANTLYQATFSMHLLQPNAASNDKYILMLVKYYCWNSKFFGVHQLDKLGNYVWASKLDILNGPSNLFTERFILYANIGACNTPKQHEQECERYASISPYAHWRAIQIPPHQS